MEQRRPKIRSFVLRSGRMGTAQQRALQELAPLYDIAYLQPDCFAVGERGTRYPVGEIDLSGLFPREQPVVVEIGFGMGAATLELAEAFPGWNLLGIEVHKPGVGKVLDEIDRRGLDNLRIYRGDAVELLERGLPSAGIAGYHIFFPDPWPKKKHHKRRLIQAPVAEQLARSLRPAGYIYAVTDWEEYAHHILEVFRDTPGLVNPYAGYAPQVSWRPRTSFERKGLEQSHPIREIWVEREG
jgi:tRNA (guanine-N7-)-methyltransferase